MTFLVCIFSVLLLKATYGSAVDVPSLFSSLKYGVKPKVGSFCNSITILTDLAQVDNILSSRT